jgi:hypothetical protein
VIEDEIHVGEGGADLQVMSVSDSIDTLENLLYRAQKNIQ